MKVNRYTCRSVPCVPPSFIPVLVLAARLCSAAIAQDASSPSPAPAAPEPEENLVVLPEFSVSTAADKGYLAGNSVSATRVDTAIKDLPFSISAFTEQFIEDIGALELLDVASYAPGVTSGAKEFTQGNNRYSIRGFDGDITPQRNGFVGTRYTDSANIQRVEVVKGPASLLYGQITPGGTVNYITKRPAEKDFVKIKGQIGTDSFWRVDLDANKRFANGRVGARIVAAYEDLNDWAEPSGGDSQLFAAAMDFKITDAITLVVDYESYVKMQEPLVGMSPNMAVPITATAANFAQLTARARAQAYIDVGNLNMGFLGYPPLPSEFNYVGDHDYRDSSFESITAELNFKLGKSWRARLNFGWSDFLIKNKLTGLAEFTINPTAAYNGATGPTRWDYIAELRANPAAVLADPTKTASALMTRRKRIEIAYGDQLSYQAEIAGRIELGDVVVKPLVGAFLTNIGTGSFRRASNQNPPASTPNELTNNSQHFQPWNYNNPAGWDRTPDYDTNLLTNLESYNETGGEDTALYAVITAEFFNERLIAIGGARYNETWSQGTDYRPTVTNPPGAPSIGDKYEAQDTTPQLGLGYKIRKDLLLFASYSESFYIEDRSVTKWNPDYNPSLPSGPTNPVTVSDPAKPVTGAGYEVGLKTDFLQGRVSSTVSLFHLERENRVLRFRQTAPDGTFPTITSQGTVDESEGVEVEVTWSPLDNLQIFATFTAMDVGTTEAEFPDMPVYSTTPAVQAAYEQAFNEAKDLVIGAVPEGSAEMLSTLWARYSFTNDFLRGWWIGGGYVYTGDKGQRTANPTLFLDSSLIWDATIGRDWKSGDVSWSATLAVKNIADTVYYNANQSRGNPQRFILSVSTKF
jgi:iron complex outermembrane receptor protein